MPQVHESMSVSFRKGNIEKGGQAQKDTYAFRANKSSKVATKITVMPVGGLCKKSVEGRHVAQRVQQVQALDPDEDAAIKDAYHVMCNRCTRERNVCAKCQESREIVLTNIRTEKGLVTEQVELERLMSGMNEREYRIYLRQMERKAKKGEDYEDEEGEAEDSGEDDSDDGDEDNEDGDSGDEHSEDERKK